MNDISQTFVMVDDSQLVMLIDSAKERVAYIAPGITKVVATALKEKFLSLGAAQVKIIIDINPEVVRLGYGTFEGLSEITTAAQEIGSSVQIQLGLRLGLLIVDQTAIVFSPIPQLIEAGSTTNFRPNGLLLDQVPSSIISEIGWGEIGNTGIAIGIVSATNEIVQQVKTKLEENPPQKFDINRKVLVFNSRFEFVELTVRGCSFSRKTIKLPSHLFGFIEDPIMTERFQGTYKLFREVGKDYEQDIQYKRKKIVDDWLITLPNYGVIILRKNKEPFLADVNELKDMVSRMQREIESEIQLEIRKSIDSLMASLLPGLTINPPEQWKKYYGLQPSLQDLRNELGYDLVKAFGSPTDWLEAMEVKVLFKAVTYETLTDEKFQRVVHRAIPNIDLIHDEYNAAPSMF